MNTIFDAGFSGQELTAAVNALDLAPTLLQGAFEERGIDTTKLLVERRAESLSLVPIVPRGAPPKPYTLNLRDGVPLDTSHIVARSTIYADTVQNSRAFGEAALYTMEGYRTDVLTKMRRDVDFTAEHMRCGALSGQVLNHDGSLVLDLLAEFGVSQQTHDMQLDVSTTKTRSAMVAAIRKSESALGNDRPKSWLCVASPTFFDALADHPNTEQFLTASPAASAELRGDMRGGFQIAGVNVVEYSFASNGTPWIANDTALLVPLGVPGLLLGRYGPADTVDAVNQIGLPLYAIPQELPHRKGLSIEVQSNPCFVVTRPRAVIKLTA